MLAVSDVATVLSLLYESRLLVIGVTGTVRLSVSEAPAMLVKELATEAAAPPRAAPMIAPSGPRMLPNAPRMPPRAHSAPPAAICPADWVAGFGVWSGRFCTCSVSPLKILLAIPTETLEFPSMPLMTPCTHLVRLDELGEPPNRTR